MLPTTFIYISCCWIFVATITYSQAADEGSALDFVAPARCLLSPVEGDCGELHQRWFFSAQAGGPGETGRCLSFMYRGCNGNDNNFDTAEDCSRVCTGQTGYESIGVEIPQGQFADVKNDAQSLHQLSGFETITTTEPNQQIRRLNDNNQLDADVIHQTGGVPSLVRFDKELLDKTTFSPNVLISTPGVEELFRNMAQDIKTQSPPSDTHSRNFGAPTLEEFIALSPAPSINSPDVSAFTSTPAQSRAISAPASSLQTEQFYQLQENISDSKLGEARVTPETDTGEETANSTVELSENDKDDNRHDDRDEYEDMNGGVTKLRDNVESKSAFISFENDSVDDGTESDEGNTVQYNERQSFDASLTADDEAEDRDEENIEDPSSVLSSQSAQDKVGEVTSPEQDTPSTSILSNVENVSKINKSDLHKTTVSTEDNVSQIFERVKHDDEDADGTDPNELFEIIALNQNLVGDERAIAEPETSDEVEDEVEQFEETDSITNKKEVNKSQGDEDPAANDSLPAVNGILPGNDLDEINLAKPEDPSARSLTAQQTSLTDEVPKVNINSFFESENSRLGGENSNAKQALSADKGARYVIDQPSFNYHSIVNDIQVTTTAADKPAQLRESSHLLAESTQRVQPSARQNSLEPAGLSGLEQIKPSTVSSLPRFETSPQPASPKSPTFDTKQLFVDSNASGKPEPISNQPENAGTIPTVGQEQTIRRSLGKTPAAILMPFKFIENRQGLFGQPPYRPLRALLERLSFRSFPFLPFRGNNSEESNTRNSVNEMFNHKSYNDINRDRAEHDSDSDNQRLRPEFPENGPTFNGLSIDSTRFLPGSPRRQDFEKMPIWRSANYLLRAPPPFVQRVFLSSNISMAPIWKAASQGFPGDPQVPGNIAADPLAFFHSSLPVLIPESSPRQIFVPPVVPRGIPLRSAPKSYRSEMPDFDTTERDTLMQSTDFRHKNFPHFRVTFPDIHQTPNLRPMFWQPDGVLSYTTEDRSNINVQPSWKLSNQPVPQIPRRIVNAEGLSNDQMTSGRMHGSKSYNNIMKPMSYPHKETENPTLFQRGLPYKQQGGAVIAGPTTAELYPTCCQTYQQQPQFPNRYYNLQSSSPDANFGKQALSRSRQPFDPARFAPMRIYLSPAPENILPYSPEQATIPVTNKMFDSKRQKGDKKKKFDRVFGTLQNDQTLPQSRVKSDYIYRVSANMVLQEPVRSYDLASETPRRTLNTNKGRKEHSGPSDRHNSYSRNRQSSLSGYNPTKLQGVSDRYGPYGRYNSRRQRPVDVTPNNKFTFLQVFVNKHDVKNPYDLSPESFNSPSQWQVQESGPVPVRNYQDSKTSRYPKSSSRNHQSENKNLRLPDRRPESISLAQAERDDIRSRFGEIRLLRTDDQKAAERPLREPLRPMPSQQKNAMLTLCFQPLDTGKCKSFQNKWYFNQYTQRCEMFYYGGCGGNTNRFESHASCARKCKVHADEGQTAAEDLGRPKDGQRRPSASRDERLPVRITTEQPQELIYVTSNVYVPDFEYSSTAQASMSDASSNSQRHDTSDSFKTSSSTDHVALLAEGKEKNSEIEESRTGGLSKQYVTIVSVLGVVGLAIILLVIVSAVHLCQKVSKSKKDHAIEDVIKSHMYGDLSQVVYSDSPVVTLEKCEKEKYMSESRNP